MENSIYSVRVKPSSNLLTFERSKISRQPIVLTLLAAVKALSTIFSNKKGGLVIFRMKVMGANL